MSWFLLSLICVFGWGCADLFYKIGSNEEDRYSHLKITVWVGLVMGVVALILLPYSESALTVETIPENALKYAPASIGYIVSMVIGYAGLRYLELSIVSPVQNASGALTVAVISVFYVVTGQAARISEAFGYLDLLGTTFIIGGTIGLAFAERELSLQEAKENKEAKKYTYGALALLFPLLYCIFDTLGTAADGIILDESSGTGLGEIDVLVLYGLTFFVAGLICYVILWMKERRPYNLFARSEWPKAAASLCEQFGQIFYVFAMAANPLIAAPMVASYCILSVGLSRIFLKEKLERNQLLCVVTVIAGIVLLGISEGLAS